MGLPGWLTKKRVGSGLHSFLFGPKISSLGRVKTAGFWSGYQIFVCFAMSNYTLLGQTCWPFWSIFLFFIGLCQAPLVGLYLIPSFLGFSDPFYSSRRAILLCLLPVHHSSLKEGLWAHFGLYFLFLRDTFPFWSIVWAMFVCFILFWAFEVQPNCLFFAHALTHFLGQLGLFSSSGLWEWISKNGYQQRLKYSLHPQGLD